MLTRAFESRRPFLENAGQAAVRVQSVPLGADVLQASTQSRVLCGFRRISGMFGQLRAGAVPGSSLVGHRKERVPLLGEDSSKFRICSVI